MSFGKFAASLADDLGRQAAKRLLLILTENGAKFHAPEFLCDRIIQTLRNIEGNAPPFDL